MKVFLKTLNLCQEFELIPLLSVGHELHRRLVFDLILQPIPLFNAVDVAELVPDGVAVV